MLRTQAEVDAFLVRSVRIGECVELILAPVERIDLWRWIGPRECCGSCGHIEPGLRLDGDGQPIDECVECGDSLITTWGDAQTERWESGARYGDPACEKDNGPQVGPIRVVRGVKRWRESLRWQANRALVKFSDDTEHHETSS